MASVHKREGPAAEKRLMAVIMPGNQGVKYLAVSGGMPEGPARPGQARPRCAALDACGLSLRSERIVARVACDGYRCAQTYAVRHILQGGYLATSRR
ncbi:hypothetical protein D3C71_1722350 [compost metagenome]